MTLSENHGAILVEPPRHPPCVLFSFVFDTESPPGTKREGSYESASSKHFGHGKQLPYVTNHNITTTKSGYSLVTSPVPKKDGGLRKGETLREKNKQGGLSIVTPRGERPVAYAAWLPRRSSCTFSTPYTQRNTSRARNFSEYSSMHKPERFLHAATSHLNTVLLLRCCAWHGRQATGNGSILVCPCLDAQGTHCCLVQPTKRDVSRTLYPRPTRVAGTRCHYSIRLTHGNDNKNKPTQPNPRSSIPS